MKPTLIKTIKEKMKDMNAGPVNVAKQSGNFVFQSMTAEEVDQKRTEEKKRKTAKDAPIPAAKRSRSERNFFNKAVDSNSLFSKM